MKPLKRMFALALAGSMILGMISVSSLAEDNTDSILMPGAEIVVNSDLTVQPEEEALSPTPEDEPETENIDEAPADEQAAVGDADGAEPQPEDRTEVDTAASGTMPEIVDNEDAGIMVADEDTVRQYHSITLIYHRMAEDTTSPTGASETDTYTRNATTGPCTGIEHAIYMTDCDPRNAGWEKTGWIGWGKTPVFDERWQPFDFPKNWKYFPVNPENDEVHIYLFYEAESKTDFVLTYDTNGGETANWTETFQSTADYFDVAVSEIIPQREGYDFLGWAAAADGAVEYAGGENIHLSELTTTLYAVWTAHVHVPEEIPAVIVTCTESGWTAGSRCQVCGEILVAQTEIPASGHEMEQEESKAATCTENGWHGGVHCKNCDHRVDAIVDPATGHTVEMDTRVEPTCTVAGLTVGSHCSVCGEVIVEQKEIPVLGHDFKAEYTFDEDRHWHTCSRCDTVEGTADHTWNEGEVTTPATCEGAGVRTYTCIECGKTRTEEIETTDHSWNEGEVTLQPTTSRTGVRTYTCTACGKQRLETIPRLPGGGGGSGGGSSSSTPSQPEEDLGDEDVPLGEGPEEDLNDGDVPLGELPFFFEDVQERDWFYNSVMYVHGKGMMSSVLKSRNIFAPMTDTTRNMVVAVLYRLDSTDELSEWKVPLTGEPIQFSDQARIPAWAGEAVAWAVSNGVVKGYRDGTFGGEREISREELVVMLYRYADSRGCDVSVKADLSVYEDADTVGKYAREAVEWAVSAGILEGVTKTRLDPAGTATRAQVAAMLERFCKLVEDNKSVA